MLWQPSLSESYIQASPDDLARRISQRRVELGKRLIILGHHYQTDEVLRHADFTGDSLKLSQLAATRVGEQGAKYVVFCGVHFMAETADMLTPEDVSVILPDLSAGCSMADMADYDETVTAWMAIHGALGGARGGARIVPITYINSSAAIKAFVGQHGGAVCTSSNARAVLRWALLGGERARGKRERIKALFLPDQHLGRNTAAALGLGAPEDTVLYDFRAARRGDGVGGASPEALARAKVILWAGHCSVHKLFRPEHVDRLRAGEAHLPPAQRTRVLVHPECSKEVVDRTDLAGSTEFIIRTIEAAQPGSRWAVGTEFHLVARLAAAAKARGVWVRILSDCQCLCTTMFRIDQAHLCWVLDHLAQGKVVNEVRVHPGARALALRALQRMLDLTGGPGGAGGAGGAIKTPRRGTRSQAAGLVD